MISGRGQFFLIGLASALAASLAVYWLNARTAPQSDHRDAALVAAFESAPMCRRDDAARGPVRYPQSRAPSLLLGAAFAGGQGHARDGHHESGHDGNGHVMAMPVPARNTGKILYYRNPMGLADISPVPKKDSMGMDYVPVYEGEHSLGGYGAHVAAGRLQRAGVRTATIGRRMLSVDIRGSGVVAYDERRVTAVTPGVEGYADYVHIPHVGVNVKAGEPLLRISTNNVQMLQIEIARRKGQTARADSGGQGLFTGAQSPASGGGGLSSSSATNSADWPAPASGVVIEKRIVTGQRIGMTDEIFRIADVSRMWVVADIAETSVAMVKAGMPVSVRARAHAGETIRGSVLFVFPALNAETRTARVCVEVPNADRRLKAEMYADVVIEASHKQQPVVTVPVSAIIDDGRREHVLVAHGEGRFEPRTVRTGMRTSDYAEVLEGLTDGESVVSAAAALIDAESRLGTALEAFAAAAGKP